MKLGILAVLALAAGGIVGCEAEVHPASATVGVGVEADVPATDVYYEQGSWDGPVWVWHDREGHVYREAREEHDRHLARLHAARAHHEDHHEEHHEEHR